MLPRRWGTGRSSNYRSAHRTLFFCGVQPIDLLSRIRMPGNQLVPREFRWHLSARRSPASFVST